MFVKTCRNWRKAWAACALPCVKSNVSSQGKTSHVAPPGRNDDDNDTDDDDDDAEEDEDDEEEEEEQTLSLFLSQSPLPPFPLSFPSRSEEGDDGQRVVPSRLRRSLPRSRANLWQARRAVFTTVAVVL